MDSDNTTKQERKEFAKHMSLKEMNKYSEYFKLKRDCLACEQEIRIKYNIEEIQEEKLKHTCKSIKEL